MSTTHHALQDLKDLKGPSYSDTIAEVRRRCQAEQDGLRPDDARLRGGVQIIHRDSSILHLRCAFSRAEGDWVYVFTANHGVLAYLKDELVACQDDGEPAEAAAAKLRHADGDGRHADRAGQHSPATDVPAESVGFGDMPISTGGLA
jgi:hypothetical protein